MCLVRYFRLSRFLLRRSVVLQLAVLVAISLIGDLLSRLFHLPVPGPALGIFLLLALLSSGLLPVACLRRGASLLLAHLMLLYVPPMLGLREHPELLSATGVELVGVVLLGTLIVMSGTALVVEHVIRRSETRVAEPRLVR